MSEGSTSIFSRMRERKLFQVVALYLGVGWGLAQVVEFAVDNYDLPRKLLDVSLFLLILGLPAAAVLAWFHGERGQQRVQRGEAAILATLLLLAGVGTYQIASADPGPGKGGRDLSAVVDLGSESVAVLPFGSRLQDAELAWLKQGAAELLTTGLAEVGSIRVVSGQRMFDLMRQEGREDTETIPPDLATRLTRRAGARYMVRGSIYGSAGQLQMRAELIDVRDGTIAATTRADGGDVFALVDRMAADLSSQILGGTIDPSELTSVASVTSRNLEAYRHYLAGIRLQRRFHPAEALEEFERAVALDSTFALAQLRLGSLGFQQGQMGTAARSLAAARRYRDSAPERDRLFLDGILAQVDNDREKARRSLGELVARYPDDKEARFALAGMYNPRDPEKGRLLREGLQLDPLDAAALNELAYFEARLGNFDTADSLVARYVELEPDEPNPLDSRGEILMKAGRHEAAREQFRAAFRMRPDFFIAVEHLAESYAEEGKFEEGTRELQGMIDRSPDAADVGLYLALASLYTESGSLRRAVEALTTAHELAAAHGEQVLDSRSLMSSLPLLISLQDWEGVALRSGQLQAVDAMNPFPSFTRIVVLAEQDSLAEAIEVAQQIRDRVDGSPALAQFAPIVLAALDRELAFYRGDYEASAAAAAAARASGGWPELGSYAELRSLLELGDGKTLEERLGRTESFVGPGETLVAKHRLYYAGRAHELTGDTAEAIESYEQLLTGGWARAVESVPILSDAPRRLEALGGQ